MKNEDALQFERLWNILAKETHKVSKDHGFWDDEDDGTQSVEDVAAYQNSRIMLIVTELAEAIEALRDGNGPSQKIPGFLHSEEELADALIRLMDLGEGYGFRILRAAFAKIEYNKSRPYRHGGKNS